MPLSRQDADDILRTVRELVRSTPLAAVDEQVIGAVFDGEPDGQLIRYLDSFLQAIAARGGYGLTGSLRELNAHVRTEDGERISSIEVVFDEDRARAFEAPRFVLQSDAPLRDLAAALLDIRAMIEREMPPRRDDRE